MTKPFKATASVFLAFLTMIGFSSPAQSKAGSDPLELYDKGMFTPAYDIWRKAAGGGDVDAKLHLVAAYLVGNWLNRDAPEILEWAQQAAAAKHPQGHYLLGLLHLEGTLTPKNTAKAREQLRLAADLGFPEAARRLAILMLNNVQSRADFDEIYRLLLFSAERGSRKAALQALVLTSTQFVTVFKPEQFPKLAQLMDQAEDPSRGGILGRMRRNPIKDVRYYAHEDNYQPWLLLPLTLRAGQGDEDAKLTLSLITIGDYSKTDDEIGAAEDYIEKLALSGHPKAVIFYLIKVRPSHHDTADSPTINWEKIREEAANGSREAHFALYYYHFQNMATGEDAHRLRWVMWNRILPMEGFPVPALQAVLKDLFGDDKQPDEGAITKMVQDCLLSQMRDCG